MEQPKNPISRTGRAAALARRACLSASPFRLARRPDRTASGGRRLRRVAPVGRSMRGPAGGAARDCRRSRPACPGSARREHGPAPRAGVGERGGLSVVG